MRVICFGSFQTSPEQSLKQKYEGGRYIPKTIGNGNILNNIGIFYISNCKI